MLQPGLHPLWSSFQRNSSLSIISSTSFLGDSWHSGTLSLGTLRAPCSFSSLTVQMQGSLEVLPTAPPRLPCPLIPHFRGTVPSSPKHFPVLVYHMTCSQHRILSPFPYQAHFCFFFSPLAPFHTPLKHSPKWLGPNG